jgi:MOSC domain-containing protein YiiM
MKKKLTGTVTHVMIGRDKYTPESSRIPRVQVTFEGFVGDQHAGLTRLSDVRVPHYPPGAVIRNTRQVSLLSIEEMADIATALQLPEVLPEWLGGNLAFKGIPHLTMLPPATRIFFPDDTVLVVDAENMPCVGPGKVIQGHYPNKPKLAQAFPKAALHKRGLVGWVERMGYINEGDEVAILLPAPVTYSYADN